jgi:hypothetical protein
VTVVLGNVMLAPEKFFTPVYVEVAEFVSVPVTVGLVIALVPPKVLAPFAVMLLLNVAAPENQERSR